MNERTNLTNFLLLSVLITILLISGSLQCAFDCLTQADQPYSPFSQHTPTERVDSCHPEIEYAAPSLTCLNKACHQRLPDHRNMGGPEIYRLEKLAHPLYSSSRQPAPQYRSGSPIILPQDSWISSHALQATTSKNPSQVLSSIRSTVLLC